MPYALSLKDWIPVFTGMTEKGGSHRHARNKPVPAKAGVRG